MFGGKSLYSEGVLFAIEAFDQVWIKADDETKPRFEAVGSAPFTYEGKSKAVTMPYWRLPESALEEPEEAARWARLGLEAARRAQAKKSKPKPARARARAPAKGR